MYSTTKLGWCSPTSPCGLTLDVRIKDQQAEDSLIVPGVSAWLGPVINTAYSTAEAPDPQFGFLPCGWTDSSSSLLARVWFITYPCHFSQPWNLLNSAVASLTIKHIYTHIDTVTCALWYVIWDLMLLIKTGIKDLLLPQSDYQDRWDYMTNWCHWPLCICYSTV